MSKEITELSRKTLKSYVGKASKVADRANDKAHKEEDAAMETNGKKNPAKQQKHLDNAAKHIKTFSKRNKGVDLAKQKLAKEDFQPLLVAAIEENALDFSKVFEKLISEKVSSLVESYKEHVAETMFNEESEQVDEISKKTLGSYISKAVTDHDKKIKNVPGPFDNKGNDNPEFDKAQNKIRSRQKGIGLARNKYDHDSLNKKHGWPKVPATDK